MLFWTKEEYKKFSFEMMDKPVSFYAFEMLYWCGIREGELLALTAADFDFEKETVRINKSYQRLHGEDVITTPKTKKSNRMIKMPKFLCEEMQEYLSMLYGLKKKDRIFTVTKSYLHHEMDRGANAAGVKRIRIHDLRHSHISLLIDMGFSAVAIEDDYRRLQERLYRMFGTESADNLFFSVSAGQLGKGLDEQLARFVAEHTDTKLIIIDTLQKVREVGGDNYSYIRFLSAYAGHGAALAPGGFLTLIAKHFLFHNIPPKNY